MNLSRSNLTSADGSFLGYLFQIERVILWLSELEESAVVGVEVADDIVVQLSNGLEIKEIYEQAKHTTGKTAPYSDKSEDLWKTLSIWINLIRNEGVNPENSKFSLLCNRPLPSNRFALKLHKASKTDSDSLDQTCEELIQAASTLSAKLQNYGAIVQNCPKDILRQLVSNIIVIDPSYNHDQQEYFSKLKSNLHLTDDLPINDISEKLFGFVATFLIDNWRNKKEAWLPVKTFNKQFIQLVTEYKSKPFFERAASSLPVSKAEENRNRGKTFVEQLKLIKCDSEEILESIHDYQRALTERDRFAKDGEISSEKFDQYFEDLIENWKTISKPRFRSCTVDEHVKTGYDVYYETRKYRGRLNNFEPEQHYTYRGAYHHLANEMNIGWHPEWLDLLKK
jgi:hypothetical protein